MNGTALVVRDRTPASDMVIFVAKGVAEGRLKQLFKEIGSPAIRSNYGIEEITDDSFLMIEMDHSPAETGIVRIKGNQLWAPRYFFTAISNQLIINKISLSWSCRSFQSEEELQWAFERA